MSSKDAMSTHRSGSLSPIASIDSASAATKTRGGGRVGSKTRNVVPAISRNADTLRIRSANAVNLHLMEYGIDALEQIVAGKRAAVTKFPHPAARRFWKNCFRASGARLVAAGTPLSLRRRRRCPLPASPLEPSAANPRGPVWRYWMPGPGSGPSELLPA